MKTVLQELIQWTLENAYSTKAQDGTTYIVVDHIEMRAKFDEWLEKDKQQTIDFHTETMKIGLIEEDERKWTDSYKPKIEEIATKHYNETFNEII